MTRRRQRTSSRAMLYSRVIHCCPGTYIHLLAFLLLLLLLLASAPIYTNRWRCGGRAASHGCAVQSEAPPPPLGYCTLDRAWPRNDQTMLLDVLSSSAPRQYSRMLLSNNLECLLKTILILRSILTVASSN